MLNKLLEGWPGKSAGPDRRFFPDRTPSKPFKHTFAYTV